MKKIYTWISLICCSMFMLSACATDRPQVIVITSTFPSAIVESEAIATSIPTPNTVATALSNNTSVPIATSESEGNGQYVVQAGDTLSGIAVNNNVSLELLLTVNNIENPDLLEVGQVIRLPDPPSASTPTVKLISDARLIRSQLATTFDLQNFLIAQTGYISLATDIVDTRLDDGTTFRQTLSAKSVIERVSLEYSVDPRILVAFLEYRASWLSQPNVPDELKSHPIISLEQSAGFDRAGLYKQLSWLANELNRGYYNWKYRGATILGFDDGNRYFYDANLNAGTVSLQYVLSLNNTVNQWLYDVSEAGFANMYQRYFGDPFVDEFEVVPAELTQPVINLPFTPGDIWRFTGGFHGGWGSGSAWAALDFAPPDDRNDGDPFCYTSEYDITAVADGQIARNSDGVVILDLDGDSNESTGWTILYLHMKIEPSLTTGQLVKAGDILGNASCHGGFSSATHLHIARRYNGEWIPADCENCAEARNTIPPFIMSNWKAVGLQNQQYQGYMVHIVDNRQIIAEQGRNTKINEISW